MVKKDKGPVFDFDELKEEKGLIRSASELSDQQANYRVYKTASLMLDAAIGQIDPVHGNGGFPERSLIEVFGVPGSTKSALGDFLAKEVLEDDDENYVLALYSEEPDMDRFSTIGLDLEKVEDRFFTLGCYVDEETNLVTAERHLDTIKKAVRDPRLKLVIIDSLKALCSEKQLFDKTGKIRELENDKKLGLMATMVGDFIKEFCEFNNSAILYMTNQMSEPIPVNGRAEITPSIGPKTPCGRYKEFMANIRIEANARPMYSEKEHILSGRKINLGLEVYYKVWKNKFANRSGYRTAVSRFMFDSCRFDRAAEVFNCAEYLGLVHKGGGGNCVIGEVKIRGTEKAIDYLRENPQIMEELEQQILPRSTELFSLKENGVEVDLAK